MKINDIFEQGGVGVVANNAKQARDPRYSTSMTKDVKPGSTAKQAAKFGNKLGKDGTPPKLRETTINEKSLAKLDLTGSEEKGDVERKASRLLRFIEKIKNSEDFLTTKGDTVKIEPSAELIASISNKLVPNILPLVGGGQIKLSELEKTPDLGGEATGKRLGKEQAAMSSLNKQIEYLKGDQPYISLKVGDEIVNAASVINTPGTPKSDFEIIDENGDSVAWISHKDGSPAEPTKFGQWAGLSNFSSHIEVRRFVEMVRSRYPDGMPRGATALAKTISDENLQKQGVYGKNFGDANYGINNVTTVLQGPVKVEEDGDVYKIVALAEFKNGQELPESYTPIFVARYISDRSDFGVPHTRMSVYPMFGRKTDFVSDEDDTAAPISQEPELFHRVTRPDWYKDYKDKPDTKSENPRKKRD